MYTYIYIYIIHIHMLLLLFLLLLLLVVVVVVSVGLWLSSSSSSYYYYYDYYHWTSNSGPGSPPCTDRGPRVLASRRTVTAAAATGDLFSLTSHHRFLSDPSFVAIGTDKANIDTKPLKHIVFDIHFFDGLCSLPPRTSHSQSLLKN